MTTRAAEAVAARLATTDGRAAVGILYGDLAWSATVGRGGKGAADSARFLLYSFTKTIIAAAILRLVAARRLELDATLPELGPATLRQVLQHTGGLPDYGHLAAYHQAVRNGDPPWSDAEFLRHTDAARLLFAPGRGWAYSNIGYMLLRRVLVATTGRPFAAALGELVLAPSGIRSAGVPESKVALSTFSFGPSAYLGGAGPPVAVGERYDPRWIATGVVGATALDAARLLHALLTGDLLPAELRATMTSGVAVGGSIAGRPWHVPGYGLGLMVEMGDVPCLALGHTGGGPGCSPAVYHFTGKARPLTVCVVTNGEDMAQAEGMTWAAADCFP